MNIIKEILSRIGVFVTLIFTAFLCLVAPKTAREIIEIANEKINE